MQNHFLEEVLRRKKDLPACYTCPSSCFPLVKVCPHRDKLTCSSSIITPLLPATQLNPEMVGGARSSPWEAAWPGFIIAAMKEVLLRTQLVSPRVWKPEGPGRVGGTGGKAHHGGSRSWHLQGNQEAPKVYNYEKKKVILFLIMKAKSTNRQYSTKIFITFNPKIPTSRNLMPEVHKDTGTRMPSLVNGEKGETAFFPISRGSVR